MTQYGVELDELASFLDGRLSKEDRAKFMKKLAESPEAYELFIETVEDLYPESQREHTAEWERDERIISEALFEPVVIPLRQRIVRHVRRFAPQYGVAAAALVIAWIVGPFIPGRFQPPTTARLIQPILASAGDSLPPGVNQVPWPATRGASVHTRDEVAMYRLGVRLVDLRYALNAGNATESRQFLEDLDDALGDIQTTQLLRGAFLAVSESLVQSVPPNRLIALSDLSDSLVTTSLDSDLLWYGKWCEAARLAAAIGNAGFFATEESRRALAGLGDLGLSGTAEEQLAKVRRLVGAGNIDADGLAVIEGAMMTVIVELGR